ncbi:hypothetical protein [Clostridium tagluense]|uniref:hypothetical protein n=1 Tax=Clostridium tagluense TaxID=360422 RepID=UPI001C0AE841|nr:hypothetical protein [Clostridium tagluense]MBU3126237.1 hypothetical protein [Clostridium tagluense]
MNLENKISYIVNYCGKYLGHENMIFERKQNFDFNIEFAEEKFIKENINKLKIIILTGEAGDGKSHLLNNMKSYIDKGWKILSEDFSQLDDGNQKEILQKIEESIYLNEIHTSHNNEKSIDIDSNKKYILAANIGILMNKILTHCPTLFSKLQNPNDNIKVINFEKRNIASDDSTFKEFVKSFLNFDGKPCENRSCKHCSDCPFYYNITEMLKSNVIDSLRTLCNAIFLLGGHLTIRELLSLISFMITHGKTCEDMQQEENVAVYRYYNIFHDNTDVLLKKFQPLDPAKKRDEVKESESKAEIIERRRKNFFTSTDIDRFFLLPVAYLSEFKQILVKLEKNEYLDIKEDDPLCNSLKYGLLKIISKEHSFGEIVLQDSPSYLGETIKTQFTADFSKIMLIWNDIDFEVNSEDDKRKNNPNVEFSQNKFYLSCVYDGDGKEISNMIKLLIDYKAFAFIMMNYENYYVYTEGFSNVEYGFGDFFIKILSKHPEFYKKMSVIFDRKSYGKFIDFDLEIYKPKLMRGDKTEKIIIKKRDRSVG